MTAITSIRPAGQFELDLLPSMYERTHFHRGLGAVARFARDVLGGEVFVAAVDGGLLGASACAQFGATGWVGGVAVVPEARGAGLGRALTEIAVARLRDRGVRTVQLFATDMGRPIYERLGFISEGSWITVRGPWRSLRSGRPGDPAALAPGMAPRPGRYPPRVRAAGGEDLVPALAVDRAATGEDRTALLSSLWPGNALVAEAVGEIRGYHLPSPWRSGGAVVAADLEAGLALLEASGRRLNGRDVALTLPEANLPAVRAVEANGQRERSRSTRMRLGPPVPWRPRAMFSAFNLFWG
jgi:GNAT superfamily N-acetyltransferase